MSDMLKSLRGQIWKSLRPSGLTSADVEVDLHQGGGQLSVRLEYDAGGSRSRSGTSTLSGATAARAALSSPSRFSVTKRNADDTSSR